MSHTRGLQQIKEEQNQNHNLVSPSPSGSIAPSGSSSTLHHSPATSSAVTIGRSDVDVIGKHSKVFIDAIEELRQYNISGVVSLPKIVVVGDQSSGKSSMMSALTGTNLPRNTGTCTKCVANITTSAADTWSCTVFLRHEYDYMPQSGPFFSWGNTSKSPFPSWVKGENRDASTLFQRITDESKLEDALRWAQIALLNPSQDHAAFIPGSGKRWLEKDTTEEAAFSPNVIVVAICGPGLPSLSFFDLPGIMANAPTEEKRGLMNAFENIAIKYISEEDSLVIFAMCMSVDAVMSSAKKVIEDQNATARCVGVLTKPDTFSDKRGDVSDWEKILTNTEHWMGYGYFATKQPGPNFKYDLSSGSYHDQARKEEEEFFDNDELWSGRWKKFRSRCGTAVIQEFLSRQLAEEISKSIPGIKGKIISRLRMIDEKLDKLLLLPRNEVQHVILKLLLKFSSQVQRSMNNELASVDHSFYGQWRSLSDDFYQFIIQNQPEVELADPSDILKSSVIEISDDDEDATTPGVPDSPSRKQPRKRLHNQNGEAPETPRKRGKAAVPASSSPIKSENSITQSSSTIPSRHLPMKGNPFGHHTRKGEKFTSIREISQKINQYAHPGMPGIINHRVFDEYCKDAVRPWKGPLQTLLRETVVLLKKELDQVLALNLESFRDTPLFHKSRTLLDEYIDYHYKREEEAAHGLYELEVLKTFTIDSSTLTGNKRKELDRLHMLRRNIRAHRKVNQTLADNPKVIRAVEPVARKEAIRKLVDETAETLSRDQFEPALSVAAYIRTYYMMAARRFTDGVCLGINNRLFNAVSENIESYLEKKLGVTESTKEAQEKCEALIADNTGVAKKRMDLMKEKSQLEACSKRLDKLCADIRHLGSQDANAEQNGDDEPSTFIMSSHQNVPAAQILPRTPRHGRSDNDFQMTGAEY
ncbi:hypothetical protein ACMFMF_002137 [Clarireedia jacksonii]